MPIRTRIEQKAADLFLITLYPPISGFDDFIGLWLFKGAGTFLVDTGPAVSAPGLIDALGELGISRLDAILLTHIHLDHAGAAGHLAERFPDSLVVCHPKAIPHLADPRRLWEGTIQALGNTGRAYAPPRPVAQDRLASAVDFAGEELETFPTPGHAVHHISYRAGKYLFAGEAAGVCLTIDGREYLRPATPPRFFLETSLGSLERLIRVAPDILCYGHYDMRADAGEMLMRHRRQLLEWARIIGEEARHEIASDTEQRCLTRLLAQDPELAAFAAMPPPVREREKRFLLNSIRGFVGDLEGLTAGSSR